MIDQDSEIKWIRFSSDPNLLSKIDEENERIRQQKLKFHKQSSERIRRFNDLYKR